MANYKIYYHDAFKTEAIKDTWSWPAFFFTWIWAFVKGMNNSLKIYLSMIFIN